MEKLLKKYQLEWTDILYLAAMTMIGLAIRAILRVVTTVGNVLGSMDFGFKGDGFFLSGNRSV